MSIFQNGANHSNSLMINLIDYLKIYNLNIDIYLFTKNMIFILAIFFILALKSSISIETVKLETNSTEPINIYGSNCPVGRYSATGLMDQNNPQDICTICGPGSSTLSTGATSCTICVIGKFTRDPHTMCGCPNSGYYSDTLGATTVLPCAAGKTSTYVAAGSISACTNCEAGKFSNTNGTSSCINCSPGYFNSESGKTNCAFATPGKYVSTYGATRTRDCVAGKYSTLYASVCKDCYPGSFNIQSGSRVCGLSRAGRYVDTYGATAAKVCIAGKYSSTTGATVCQSCSSGKSSSAGASICQ